MSNPIIATVLWFNHKTGFGFAEADGTDIFIHYKAIQADGYRGVTRGQVVEVDTVETDRGLRAEKVVLIK